MRSAIRSPSCRRTASATRCRATTPRSSSFRSRPAKRTAAACTPRKIEYAGNETQVTWSPDSKQLAFVGQPGRFKNQRLFVVDAAGGKPQDLLGAWPYEPGQIQWLKSGQISMATSTGGSHGVYSIDPVTQEDHDCARRTPAREHAGLRRVAAAHRLRRRRISRTRPSCSSRTPTARASESSRRSTTS